MIRDNKRKENKRKKPEKKPRKGLKIAIIVLLIVLVPLLAFGVYLKVQMSIMNRNIAVDQSAMMDEEEPEALPSGIEEADANDLQSIDNTQQALADANPDIVNILLLGLDTRDPDQFEGGRTDSMIIMSLDTVHNEIKLTSIMRDTLISIPGHDKNRINTVFGFSGPQAAMDTVEKYFGIKIDNYAVVNFWALANIIDQVGGVQITVDSDELGDLNSLIDEINRYSKNGKSSHVSKAGSQLLDGKQAVAYMRIRHVGNADFERTERQRDVLLAITQKDISLAEVIKIANGLPQNMRTDMNEVQLLKMANTAYGLKSAPIKQLRLPIDGSYKNSSYKAMSILILDFDKNAAAVKDFIYNQ